MKCFFVTDLHGHEDRYEKLFKAVESGRPYAVFIGGDILPHGFYKTQENDFIRGFFLKRLEKLRSAMGDSYPRVLLILGNDDARTAEDELTGAEKKELLEYVHFRKVKLGKYPVYGYSFVPPTPFMLKDWEKYDVGIYVDPGCIPPEEGFTTYREQDGRKKFSTIKDDLDKLAGDDDVSGSIFLFHSPPHDTGLDRIDAEGKFVDNVPVDVNAGSIAIRRFIEHKQPVLTLHGHIHESARLTGKWKDRIGKTYCFSAAHDGKELALVKFSPDEPETAVRELV